MGIGSRGNTIPQNLIQADHGGIWERVIPFLPPWAAAAATWPVAALAHQMWGTDPAALPWATAGMTVIGGGLSLLTSKVAAGQQGRRAHSVGTVAGTSAWMTAAMIAGPGTHPLIDMWLMGAPALAISWNVRRLLKTNTKGDGENNTENKFFKAVKLAGTKVRGEIEVAPNKVTMPLQLPPGELNADDVSSARGRIASGLSVPKNAVRVTPDPDHHDRATLTVVPQDMLKEPTPWPGPSAFGGSIMDPIVIGLYEDGELVGFWFPGSKEDPANPRNATHGLVMGMNGSGKSHTAKEVWAEICTRTDAVLWVADPSKGKQTLGQFLPYLDWAAMTPEEGTEMIECLPDVIRARASRLGELGLDQWVPGCGMPYLVVWIEEASSLVRDSDTITDLVQQARSAGISIIISLQRAAYTQLPTDTRAQLGLILCHGVKSEMDATFALSEETLDAGACPQKWQNKKVGYAYLEAPGVDSDRFAMPLRSHMHDDDQLVEAMQAALDAGFRPEDAGPVTATAAGAAYANRTRHASTATQEAPMPIDAGAPPARPATEPENTPQDPFSGSLSDEEDLHPEPVPESPEPDLEADSETELPAADGSPLPEARISLSEAKTLLNEVLAEIRESGATTVGPKDVLDTRFSGVRSRSWISPRLAQLADEGHLIETATEGVYRFPPADPPAAEAA